MAASSGLTAALKRVVRDLEDDLRDRVEGQPEVLGRWTTEHGAARERERTAMAWEAWRDDRVTQAAVAWVLTTVFVRFCEDNRLLRPVWIAGPVERRQEALDAELDYFRRNPEHTDREWLLQAVEHLRSVRATRDLVESHSPLWSVAPSGQAAKRLLQFWRATDETGALVHDFTDPQWSTRFLGDLYQDLSDYAKATFALLQTPVFVEEFILDRTLEPALAERPLEGFRLIDPACGSGHFLLGAFARLNDRWADHAPGLEVQARVQEALDAIHGVDLNPFAVAIARFRLLVAALRACGLRSLEDAPNFGFHLAVGDSLLHGGHQRSLPYEGFDADSSLSGFTYSSEDLKALQALLEPGRYDVVVGNPPYITVKDRKLNAAYRALFPTCKGTYGMTVPFLERFFQLAKRPSGDQPAGWTGQITSNAFMKREFGSRLIEDFLVRQDLRLVVDTSGAYIPGHGTPTVILVGRPQPPVGSRLRAVLGIRGEPGQPPEPAKGVVWSSIVEHVDEPSFDNDYVTVTDLERAVLATHPWSLGGGEAAALLRALQQTRAHLKDRSSFIGYSGQTNSDGAFLATQRSLSRRGVEPRVTRAFVAGDEVRDYRVEPTTWSIFPYVAGQLVRIDEYPGLLRWMWPCRTVNWARATFSKNTYRHEGRTWFEWHQIALRRMWNDTVLTYPNVATHNHFALDRDGRVFNPHAPFIMLPKGASEDDHLSLLGVLNSSTACFWLKQNSHNKGEGGGARVDAGYAARGEPFRESYEFTGTTLQDYPLPERLPLRHARRLDELAKGLTKTFANAVPPDGMPTPERLAEARHFSEQTRCLMVALQEELDWEVYRAYGLIDADLTYRDREPPGISLGERAFEIALARRVAAGEEQTTWFSHPLQVSTPVTEVPSHWPADYRALMQRRLELIDANPFMRLLERPEHKRRWAAEPWVTQVDRALRGWLLDRLEDRRLWFDAQGRPQTRSVAQLGDVVARDGDLVSVLELWSGRKDRSVVDSLTALLDGEGVPFLAAYRLKDSGLRKRAAWERTWDLQRREDAGETVGDIPVPPKYTSADFRKPAWWQHRGKLDVPKERFVLYPEAGRETDATALLGWAGWDHAQQALALARVVAERQAEGWSDERLVPLVAGLAELQPWVRQWHDRDDPTYGVNLADYLEEELRSRAGQVGHTLEALAAWRPAAPTRGRKARAAR